MSPAQSRPYLNKGGGGGTTCPTKALSYEHFHSDRNLWDRINWVPGLGTEFIGYRTACPTNTPVRTAFFEEFINGGGGGGGLRSAIFCNFAIFRHFSAIFVLCPSFALAGDPCCQCCHA